MYSKKLEIPLSSVDMIRKHNRRLFKEMCNIYRSSPGFGRPLMKWLQDHDALVVMDPAFTGSGLCMYEGGRPVLHINVRDTERYNEMLLHEGFHAVQLCADDFDFQFDQDFEEGIMHHFALEAGAVSFTAAAQYEMLLNGQSGPFRYRQNMSDPLFHYIDKIYRVFEETYTHASETGQGRIEALQTAGAAAFSIAFETPVLVQEYLDQYISVYVDYMQQYSKYYGHNIASGRDVGIFGILPSGHSLSAHFNLEAAKSKTFNSYPGFQDALDWLQYQRITLRGDQASHFTIQKRERQALINSNNPFLSVSYADFETSYIENLERPQSERKPVLELLKQLSGDPSAQQLHFDFHQRKSSFIGRLFRGK